MVVWAIFFFIPLKQTWIKRRPQIQRLQRDLTQTRQRMAHLKASEEELSRLAAQYELPSVTLAPEEQLPELLERIAQLAHASHVHLLAVKPKADFDRLNPGASGYLELPVTVEASAGYHQVGAFLDALERSESLVRVQELKIQANESDLWNHDVAIVLQTYLVPGARRNASVRGTK